MLSVDVGYNTLVDGRWPLRSLPALAQGCADRRSARRRVVQPSWQAGRCSEAAPEDGTSTAAPKGFRRVGPGLGMLSASASHSYAEWSSARRVGGWRWAVETSACLEGGDGGEAATTLADVDDQALESLSDR